MFQVQVNLKALVGHLVYVTNTRGRNTKIEPGIVVAIHIKKLNNSITSSYTVKLLRIHHSNSKKDGGLIHLTVSEDKIKDTTGVSVPLTQEQYDILQLIVSTL